MPIFAGDHWFNPKVRAAYSWFREQPISTRAKQFAVGYTAAGRALEGDYLGAIGAIRYWPKNTTRQGIRYRSKRRLRRQRHSQFVNYKRIRGSRTSKTYYKSRKSRNYRKRRKKRLPYWLWLKQQRKRRYRR